MKLQNTLFIATAICFYILLCSQPADSCLIIRWLKTVFERDLCEQTTMTVSTRNDISVETTTTVPTLNNSLERCNHKRTCSNPDKYTCSSIAFKNETEGFCVPSCKSDGSCSNENHRCVRNVGYPYGHICLRLTKDEWDLLDGCHINEGIFDCFYPKSCFSRIPLGSWPGFKCLKHSDMSARSS